jgi:aerotaxis receptor
MRHNSPVTGVNIDIPQGVNILSTTDTQSIITYVNPDFIKISGFKEVDLIGQPHNIVRHPDMPSAAFEHMWSTLKAGKSWMGIIKNRCKNGDHYWVSAYATPISKDGHVSEYQSVRTKPEHSQIKAAEKLYARLRDGRAPQRTLPNLGLATKLSAFVCVLIALSFLGASSVYNMPLNASLLAAGLGCTLSSIAINVFLLTYWQQKLARLPIIP